MPNGSLNTLLQAHIYSISISRLGIMHLEVFNLDGNGIKMLKIINWNWIQLAENSTIAVEISDRGIMCNKEPCIESIRIKPHAISHFEKLSMEK
jgi:hypothetical protein